MMKLLVKSPLLAKLPASVILHHLKSGCFSAEQYAKGSVVLMEGECCDTLKIIVSGSLAADSIDEHGNFLTVSAFDFGCGVGGNLIFLDEPIFPLTIMAAEDCVLLSIGRETLFSLLCEYPDFLRQYLRFTGMHAYRLNDKIKAYTKRSIRENVLLFLERERQVQQSSKIKLRTSKKAMAEQLGIQRSSLSRELAKMRADGLIDFDAGSITILGGDPVLNMQGSVPQGR